MKNKDEYKFRDDNFSSDIGRNIVIRSLSKEKY